MRVRGTLTVDLNVQSPSEAAKVLEPLFAAVPAEVEQFSWNIKGQEWFEPRASRVKREKTRPRTSRTRSDDF